MTRGKHSNFTPGIDPNTSLPDLGTERIDNARFSGTTDSELEWRQLWRRVWNPGPREEELMSPGDFVVHELGKESLLFVRGDDGEVRGFYNVCQHRGNLLVSGSRRGNARFFQCGFHAWSYNTDGGLKGIPQANTFPNAASDRSCGNLDLEPITVDQWGGFIWFHLDHNPNESLLDFLGEIPEHLAPYKMEDMRILEYKSFLWDANWKVVADAFNESYHFRGLHPQMLKWSDEVASIELLGRHSRMINRYGTTSTPYEGETVHEELREWMRYYGMDPDAYKGRAENVWKAKVEHSRNLPEDSELTAPYDAMTDDQLTAVYHYFIFPGLVLNMFPEGVNAFRYRPHPTDPQKMYYDLIMMVHYPKGQSIPWEHRQYEEPVKYKDIADAPIADIVTEVLQQDADNVAINQRGLRSDGFRGMYLGEQELRLRHFHQVLDHYLGRSNQQGE